MSFCPMGCANFWRWRGSREARILAPNMDARLLYADDGPSLNAIWLKTSLLCVHQHRGMLRLHSSLGLGLLVFFQSTVALVMSASTTPTVRLWNSGTCPYAQRVWIALLEKHVPFEHKLVDLQDKPADFTAVYNSVSPDPTARAKVPILEVGDDKLIESSVCAEYVAEAFAQNGAPLIPDDPLRKARMRLLSELFSTTIQNYWPLLLADSDEQRAKEAAKLDNGLTVLDTFLHKYAAPDGPYFLGTSFSLAEVLIAPFLQRLLVVAPHWAGYDPLARAEALGLIKVRAWMQAVVSRKSCLQSDCDKEVTISSYKRMVDNMKAASASK